MYFRVCHRTPTIKNLEITNCLQENQIFRYYNSKNSSSNLVVVVVVGVVVEVVVANLFRFCFLNTKT